MTSGAQGEGKSRQAWGQTPRPLLISLHLQMPPGTRWQEFPTQGSAPPQESLGDWSRAGGGGGEEPQAGWWHPHLQHTSSAALLMWGPPAR